MTYTLNTSLKRATPQQTFGLMPRLYENVTVHNAGTKASALAVANFGLDNSPLVDYHYAVDENEVIQLYDHKWALWHAGDGRGDGNMLSIGIEIARDLDIETDRYPRAEDNAARLAAKLLKDRGLGIDRLKRHYDWNGKLCPYRFFRAEAGTIKGRTWAQFKALVKSYMEEKPMTDTGNTGGGIAGKTFYRVQVGAFGEYENAANMLKALKKLGYDPVIVAVKPDVAPTPAPTPKPVGFAVGDKVRVKQGAKTYNGRWLASFVYQYPYTVLQVNGDRIVIGQNGIVTAAVKAADLMRG